MTDEQAKKMLKAKLECLKRETSGIDCNAGYNCDECELLYAQGTAGEQKKALNMAIQALEQISHLTDRPCSVCEFHKEDGCSKWDCVFETEEGDTDAE